MILKSLLRKSMSLFMRDKASSLGITAADIENAFNFSYSYNYVTRIETAIDQYNVILELFDKYQMDTNIFNSLWMRSSVSNDLVPMGAVAQMGGRDRSIKHQPHRSISIGHNRFQSSFRSHFGTGAGQTGRAAKRNC